MRAAYTIFPHSGYVLESFRGAVTYEALVRFTARQKRDPRILIHYRTVSDYEQATLHLTESQVRQYANAIYASPAARLGNRAMVVVGPRNLAVASMLEMFAVEHKVQTQCFRSRDAAFRWLDVKQVPASANRKNTNLSYLSEATLEASAVS